MTTLADYFSKIFVINLARRTDRLEQCEEEFARHGFSAERFEAYGGLLEEGKVNGNKGCTASHRALLEIIAYHRWPRVLVLEDDFQVVHPNFGQLFSDMIGSVPADWDLLYLGGHYADKPLGRVNAQVIRAGRMFTTSSYGVTWQAARRMAPHISGVGPIDVLYSGFCEEQKHYILQPRLMVQRAGYSDLLEKEYDPGKCMADTRHERMV